MKYAKRTEFTALQVYRIAGLTYDLYTGHNVDLKRFDTVINLIDRVNPNLTFEELKKLCEEHQINNIKLWG